MADSQRDGSAKLVEVRRLYQQAEVFTKALQLVEKYKRRALEVADNIEPKPLRALFFHLIDTVLKHPAK